MIEDGAYEGDRLSWSAFAISAPFLHTLMPQDAFCMSPVQQPFNTLCACAPSDANRSPVTSSCRTRNLQVVLRQRKKAFNLRQCRDGVWEELDRISCPNHLHAASLPIDPQLALVAFEKSGGGAPEETSWYRKDSNPPSAVVGQEKGDARPNGRDRG